MKHFDLSSVIFKTARTSLMGSAAHPKFVRAPGLSNGAAIRPSATRRTPVAAAQVYRAGAAPMFKSTRPRISLSDAPAQAAKSILSAMQPDLPDQFEFISDTNKRVRLYRPRADMPMGIMMG